MYVPTLEHMITGVDTVTELKLAHRWCNQYVSDLPKDRKIFLHKLLKNDKARNEFLTRAFDHDARAIKHDKMNALDHEILMRKIKKCKH